MTSDDENGPGEVQEWMDSVAKGQSPIKKLIFDKESKRLVLVTPDDPRFLSTDESISFTPEDRKRFGGGPDFLAIIASVATVTQAVLMIADMWARKHKGESAPNEKTAKEDWNEVDSINVLMSDGNEVYFNAWRTEPSKLKDFLTVFRSSPATPRPVSITFQLDNGSRMRIDISGDQSDDDRLDVFIKQLRNNHDRES